MSSLGRAGNVEWVEGVRGIAAFFVVISHLCRTFDYELFYPSDWDMENDVPLSPRVWQLPIIRMMYEGRISVAAFAFLTGFVCALKPLRLAREGDHAHAISNVARSAFKRTPRLVIPTTLVLLVVWTLVQLGATRVGSRCDSEWIRMTTPQPAPDFTENLYRLFYNFRLTWYDGWMEYDHHQWAILPLLKGSFIVYITLIMTVSLRFSVRIMVYTFLYAYWWQNPKDLSETFGMQMCFGMLLCDLTTEPEVQKFCQSRWIQKLVAPILIILGLYVASYPEGLHDRVISVPWSAQLESYNDYIFPAGVKETMYGKRWAAFGMNLACVGIWLSPSVKDFLSLRPFTYLGRVSFAVYLLHGILMRSVLMWMVYGTSPDPKVNDEGEVIDEYLHRSTGFSFALANIIFILLSYVCAHFWTIYVDPWCERVIRKFEEYAYGIEEKGHPLLLY